MDSFMQLNRATFPIIVRISVICLQPKQLTLWPICTKAAPSIFILAPMCNKYGNCMAFLLIVICCQEVQFTGIIVAKRNEVKYTLLKEYNKDRIFERHMWLRHRIVPTFRTFCPAALDPLATVLCVGTVVSLQLVPATSKVMHGATGEYGLKVGTILCLYKYLKQFH